jgi:hypothetical protein
MKLLVRISTLAHLNPERTENMSIDTAVAGLKADFRRLNKEIEDCVFWHHHDPSNYGPKSLRIEYERNEKIRQIAALDSSRPLDERREWRPSRGAFTGSNY